MAVQVGKEKYKLVGRTTKIIYSYVKSMKLKQALRSTEKRLELALLKATAFK
jgi:hypothetical protein